jgi:hypothetical protein
MICSIGEFVAGLTSSEGKVAEAGVSRGGRIGLDIVVAILS